MISQKFSIIPEDQIASFMSESWKQKEEDSLLDSIESVSDLWVLANMNETFNEEINSHNSVAGSYFDVCPSVRGEDTSSCCHRLG
ncbi:MAG: hypothetical protein J6L79_02550 [Muribaculaceae bacterium]|nr:hypothetical protein [Muribaculaceae bacterium]